jgi:hypothetical protein
MVLMNLLEWGAADDARIPCRLDRVESLKFVVGRLAGVDVVGEDTNVSG